MINAKVDHCTTLEEFYLEIRTQQELAHGIDYCYHHDAIRKYLEPGFLYKELGTHQGATAAAACLALPRSVELVDISLAKFNYSRSLFEQFCTNNSIVLVTKELDSTHKDSVSYCDILLIDSYHSKEHLQKELKLHSSYVSKYIILHDTSMLHGKPNETLYNVAVSFSPNIWMVVERSTSNVGYTVLGKR